MESEDLQRAKTPDEVAKGYHVKVDKIYALIASGELRAIDVSDRPGIGRPRWRILFSDLVVFENRRAAKARIKPARRRRKALDVTEYF